MAVLKVARQLNLVRDLDTVAVPGRAPVPIPEALLRRAVEHGADALLVDAMALACAHPKSTAVPGALPGHSSLALCKPRHDSGGHLSLPTHQRSMLEALPQGAFAPGNDASRDVQPKSTTVPGCCIIAWLWARMHGPGYHHPLIKDTGLRNECRGLRCR